MPINKENIFDAITCEKNIYNAYKQTQKGKSKYKSEAIRFGKNETHNIKFLRESLINETYEFGRYERFTVYEPKERIIDAPQYIDKIVQIAINNVLKDVYYPSFIYDSYSCIDNKGTHKCVSRIRKFMQMGKRQYREEAFVVKIDIKKFFYSIDRKILKSILTKRIKCKKTLNLLYKIIDSADSISELGLPLGNTFSQMGANIYMNVVDQYAKRSLGIKYYIRYADDIFVIVKNKKEAIETSTSITSFLQERLKLETNKNKSKIFPLGQGINGIGFKIYTTHILLRNDSKKRIKRKIKGMKRLLASNKMTISKAEQMLNSWKGHADFANSYNFTESLMAKSDFVYKDTKGRLRVDINKIKEGE